MFKNLLPVFFLGALALSGCATTSKDFKVDAIKPDEGAIVGRVKVVYNGNDFTDQCAVCFNSVNGPCYKLDKTGLVFMKIKAGPTSLRRVACTDTSEQHYHMNGANFDVAQGSKTYFGDVVINWTNKGGFKISSMFGLIGAVADQSSNDGNMLMKVSDNPKPVLSSYQELIGKKDDNLPLKHNLVSLGN